MSCFCCRACGSVPPSLPFSSSLPSSYPLSSSIPILPHLFICFLLRTSEATRVTKLWVPWEWEVQPGRCTHTLDEQENNHQITQSQVISALMTWSVYKSVTALVLTEKICWIWCPVPVRRTSSTSHPNSFPNSSASNLPDSPSVFRSLIRLSNSSVCGLSQRVASRNTMANLRVSSAALCKGIR